MLVVLVISPMSASRELVFPCALCDELDAANGGVGRLPVLLIVVDVVQVERPRVRDRRAAQARSPFAEIG